MNCHRCDGAIDIVAQITDAADNYWEGAEAPIILLLDCDTCKTATAMVEIVPMDESDFQEVEIKRGPQKGNTVKIPKL